MDPNGAAPHGPFPHVPFTYVDDWQARVDLVKSPKGAFYILSPSLWLGEILECFSHWEELKICFPYKTVIINNLIKQRRFRGFLHKTLQRSFDSREEVNLNEKTE